MRHNIFALELCMRLEPGDTLRDSLRSIIVNHPAASSPGKKWGLLKKATELLLSAEHLYEKGCWDFFEDDDRARRDYDMWSNGMITEEGSREGPSGAPSDGEPRFMTFTISLLLDADTRTAEGLANTCSINQYSLWQRSTFTKILAGLSAVSFTAVKSDVYYLIPGDSRWGLTAEDLRADKFHYLRDVVG